MKHEHRGGVYAQWMTSKLISWAISCQHTRMNAYMEVRNENSWQFFSIGVFGDPVHAQEIFARERELRRSSGNRLCARIHEGSKH